MTRTSLDTHKDENPDGKNMPCRFSLFLLESDTLLACSKSNFCGLKMTHYEPIGVIVDCQEVRDPHSEISIVIYPKSKLLSLGLTEFWWWYHQFCCLLHRKSPCPPNRENLSPRTCDPILKLQLPGSKPLVIYIVVAIENEAYEDDLPVKHCLFPSLSMAMLDYQGVSSSTPIKIPLYQHACMANSLLPQRWSSNHRDYHCFLRPMARDGWPESIATSTHELAHDTVATWPWPILDKIVCWWSPTFSWLTPFYTQSIPMISLFLMDMPSMKHPRQHPF